MEESMYFKIVATMEEVKQALENLKFETTNYDGRALSIAITHLETAQLWFANSVKNIPGE